RIFDEPVQVVQVDVGQQRADNTSLRCTAGGFMIPPVFHVSSPEQAVDQRDQSAIVNVSPDDLQQDRVIDVVETAFDVTLDEPNRSAPRLANLSESRVATPFR